MNNCLLQKKLAKSVKIKSILTQKREFSLSDFCFNFLPDELSESYGLVETSNISSHQYDCYALEIINSKPNGFFLDCGSGKRNDYFENVVNLEIVNYESTDVLAIGEQLPFKDESFDGVFSLNVLEHVKDPFKCASEISRVLKVGGILYCVVPFMSPYHDFPDHYYNMTKSGLRNLFDKYLKIQKQDVIMSGLPIFSLTWILNNWIDGLTDDVTREDFLEMKVKDLIGSPTSYLDKSFVSELSKVKNFELGATTALWASK